MACCQRRRHRHRQGCRHRPVCAGIFGDSGVTYSKGVEDLLASAFGATRQAKPLKDANVDEYAGELADKAKAAIFGN